LAPYPHITVGLFDSATLSAGKTSKTYFETSDPCNGTLYVYRREMPFIILKEEGE
jgi:hypothetical protein